MNTRRKLVIALGAGALTAPFPSLAQQQSKVWRVGFLNQRHVDFVDADYYYGPFTQGLRDLGYVVGKNLVIEWRSAEGNSERLPDLAAELVRLNLDVLLTGGTPATVAAQKATSAIPIVMINVSNPVESGLVKSLSKPGSNSTGLSNMISELGPKQLEMLRTMAPKITSIAVLVNASNPTSASVLKSIQAAAQTVGVKILPVRATTPEEIANGFASMVRENAGGLIVPQEAFLNQQKNQIVTLAAKQRLPSIAAYGEYVESGGLMSYGQNIRENPRRAAFYVDKILRGAKPADLPVEQPTKFEMFINGRTAKALGLKIPQSLLIMADKVIE